MLFVVEVVRVVDDGPPRRQPARRALRRPGRQTEVRREQARTQGTRLGAVVGVRRAGGVDPRPVRPRRPGRHEAAARRRARRGRDRTGRRRTWAGRVDADRRGLGGATAAPPRVRHGPGAKRSSWPARGADARPGPPSARRGRRPAAGASSSVSDASSASSSAVTSSGSSGLSPPGRVAGCVERPRDAARGCVTPAGRGSGRGTVLDGCRPGEASTDLRGEGAAALAGGRPRREPGTWSGSGAAGRTARWRRVRHAETGCRGAVVRAAAPARRPAARRRGPRAWSTWARRDGAAARAGGGARVGRSYWSVRDGLRADWAAAATGAGFSGGSATGRSAAPAPDPAAAARPPPGRGATGPPRRRGWARAGGGWCGGTGRVATGSWAGRAARRGGRPGRPRRRWLAGRGRGDGRCRLWCLAVAGRLQRQRGRGGDEVVHARRRSGPAPARRPGPVARGGQRRGGWPLKMGVRPGRSASERLGPRGRAAPTRRQVAAPPGPRHGGRDQLRRGRVPGEGAPATGNCPVCGATPTSRPSGFSAAASATGSRARARTRAAGGRQRVAAHGGRARRHATARADARRTRAAGRPRGTCRGSLVVPAPLPGSAHGLAPSARVHDRARSRPECTAACRARSLGPQRSRLGQCRVRGYVRGPPAVQAVSVDVTPFSWGRLLAKGSTSPPCGMLGRRPWRGSCPRN